MCTKADLDFVLQSFVSEIKRMFGTKLKQVILYGSYARGDYNEKSDVDIMVIADIEESEIMQHVYTIAEYLGELLLDYDIVISPVIESHEKFMKYKDIIPFFKNVQKEGIGLVA